MTTLIATRLGDFYEFIGEDNAQLAGSVFGITVTRRRGREPIAGVPAHAIVRYLAIAKAQGIEVVFEAGDAPVVGIDN